jgi:hypothetical protein
MRSLVAAFAQQQLRDMQELQRELGRRREAHRPADVPGPGARTVARRADLTATCVGG